MRKTRSRNNEDLIKIVPENKDEDDMALGRTPKKRGRPKTQLEKKAIDLSASGSASPNLNELVGLPEVLNDETILPSKKAPKTMIRNVRPRKAARNLKNELSKSNFCMTKILQNDASTEALKGDKIIKYIDQFIITSTEF